MSQYKDLAHIYDELINCDVDYKAWANKILTLCSNFNIEKKDYLDLACGTGNLTEQISKEFKATWAVDLSSSMLTEAESKLRTHGIRAKFICQDICNLKLNQKFDLITCCLDATNYILDEIDLKAYFIGVFQHLKDNGVFIFDINSYYKLTNILGNNVFTFDDDKVVYIWDNYLENDIVDMKLTFFVKEEGNYKRFDEEHSERAYKQVDIEKIIEKAGFVFKGKLNNYEGISIDEKCERIAYILTK
ncbi:class I SAM-dependent DNA methyltransferase [Candidatus Clostridium stratigraminis]|uniref:Class I SAM-dependent DNA methyltransferase n=1 Tax=Candidatus Clostridium stratigraminis TaxID=3381661 RepID=A0ABW8T760_9CLOT